MTNTIPRSRHSFGLTVAVVVWYTAAFASPGAAQLQTRRPALTGR